MQGSGKVGAMAEGLWLRRDKSCSYPFAAWETRKGSVMQEGLVVCKVHVLSFTYMYVAYSICLVELQSVV